ncbi:MAG: hypothetical protein WCV93_00190 [Candidatus Shapirobacteria bacterium]|jgi:hypothetical protein
MRKIIVVTGLGDDGKATALATVGWKKLELRPIVFVPKWENKEGLESKLAKLLEIIDKESKTEKIFLLGISAGASLAMNAFMQRLDRLEKLVSVCGRLRFGWSRDKIKRKLQENTLSYLAFRESVEMLEKNIKYLGKVDRRRIMTVSAKFGDEMIPRGTSQLPGAKNILIPTIGHLLSILSAMTANFEPIRKFLVGESSGLD